MRVQRRCARGFVFLFAQDFAEVLGSLRELPVRVPVEGPRQRAPSGIARQSDFLRVGRVAVFRFQGFKRLDGRDIVAGFLGETALADAVLRR